MIIWVMKIFFVVLPCILATSSQYLSSASVRSIPFLSFIKPIFAWNVPLLSLIFLKRSLVFPILLFYSISLHWLLKKAFYLFLLFLEICIQTLISFLFSFAFRLSSFHSYLWGLPRKPFCFFAFLFHGMVLIPVSCTLSWTSIHSSSGTLSIRSRPLNLLTHFHCLIIRDLI